MHQKVRALIKDSGVQIADAASLVMLYAIRYQAHANNDTRGLVATLSARPGALPYTKVSSVT